MPTQEIDGFLHILSASNNQDIQKAIEYLGTPAFNLIYADTAGNIGNHLCGTILNSRTYPVKSSTFQKILSANELPLALNPSSGYLISDDNHNYHENNFPQLSYFDFGIQYRMQRTIDLFNSTKNISVQDMMTFQNDQKSLLAEEIIPYLLKVIPIQTLSQNDPLEKAYHLLKSWDSVDDINSIPSTIFYFFFNPYRYRPRN